MTQSPTLFTYIIPIDDGAAPNPFNGMCTLAICKPGIRKTAKVGDWVAGFGSKNAPSGNLRGRMVYAMRVDEVMTLQEYDEQADERWPHRIPRVDSPHLVDRLGDCIYDYSSGRPVQRNGVHVDASVKRDLSGQNVLIAQEEFYYFGSNAIKLPKALRSICSLTQGHRSRANDRYVADFLGWIKSEDLRPGQLYGWPDYVIEWGEDAHAICSAREDDEDNEV